MSESKIYILLIVLAIAVALMAAAIYGNLVFSESKTEHTLTVSGFSKENVVPDTASINIGVIVQGTNASEASNKNSNIMNNVISELKKTGLHDKEIQTSYISLQPVYDNNYQNIVAYSATNSVQVSTENISILNDIIDKSKSAGANQIGSISFSISDKKQQEIHNQLYKTAISNASSKAQILASNLNVRIIGVQKVSVNEGLGIQAPASSIYSIDKTANATVATPIQPGQNDVPLSIEVTYIIK